MTSFPSVPADLASVCWLARATAEGPSLAERFSPEALERAVQPAHAHNALGVILPALRRRGGALPGPFEERLTASEMTLAAQALFLESELDAVLKLLEVADVEVAVLKGAFLASCVYGDFAQRPMGDFDLLLRREDLPRAAVALHREGYSGEEGWPCQVPPGGSLELESPSGQAIELRYELTQGTRLRGIVTFREEEMWRRRRTFATASGGSLLSLDLTDHLLYLLYHAGMMHLFAALIWLVDIDRFIRKFQAEIAWDTLVRRAREVGCATCLWHGLGLARQLLDTPVEDSVLRGLQPRPLRAGLIQHYLAAHRILHGMVPPRQPRMQLLQMLLLDTTGADVRSLWQGLFPPRQWLEWRYRTSNPATLVLLRGLYPFGGWARPRT